MKAILGKNSVRQKYGISFSATSQWLPDPSSDINNVTNPLLSHKLNNPAET